MKRNLLTLLVLLFAGVAMAQDVIIKNDKTEILCRVVEIESEVVKYKKWDNQTGPTYSVKKTDVFMIRYENGTTETFDDELKTKQPVVVEKKEDNTPEVKDFKNSIRFGVGVGNLPLMVLVAMGDGGSQSTLLFQYATLPSKKRWFTSTASFSLLSAYVNNFNNDNVNVTFVGLQSKFKAHGHYVRNERSSLYSGIGIGYLAGAYSISDPNYKINTNSSFVTWQLDLIGAQVRWNHFGIFGEFGIGYEGIVKSGLFVAW